MNRRDKILGLVFLVVLAGVFLMSLLLLVATGVGGVGVSSDHIAVVEIKGMIISPSSIVERLERIIRDDHLPAIVIRLNTPGGGISATQEIYDTVLKARDAGKIVIASMGSVAASGGYYIAAACDTIVATPGTITGSIGVIASFTEFSELFDKIGITFNVRKSGIFKDTGSISREMTDEEAELIDMVIMDTYDQFVEAVSLGRGLDPGFVREYADGRIFTGRQAQELGFVDELGTYQDAIDMAGTLTGLGENPPTYKEQRGVFWEMIVDGMSSVTARALERAAPRFAYLWAR